MKAKEYFEKYDVLIMHEVYDRSSNGKIQHLEELVQDFATEFKLLIEKRGVKTTSGAVAVLKELNDKWNAICRLYEKKYNGVSPIREDGLKNGILTHCPELEEYFTVRK